MSHASDPGAVEAAASAPPAAWLAVFSLAFGAFGLVTAEFLPVSLLTPMAAELAIRARGGVHLRRDRGAAWGNGDVHRRPRRRAAR